MFSLPNLVESAWTPELGGAFGSLQLCVKPYLYEERRAAELERIALKQSGVEVDLVGGFRHDMEMFGRLVIGWRGIADEFNAENLERLVKACAGQPVGIEGHDQQPLYLYVLGFAADQANFTGEAEGAEKKS